MKIFVKVKTGGQEEGVKPLGNGHYAAIVKAQPIDGRANDDLRRLLGRYFGVAPSLVRIVHGQGRRLKLIEVPLSSAGPDPCGEES